ncbi:MAG TPA: S41 family peptidase [Thermoguttaceae bacterium]|nr:S41 family peptidase [Thermoguttaceae bacterium]
MVRRAPVLLLAFLLLWFGSIAAGAAQNEAAPPNDDYYELYKLLVDTMDQVERNYVKEIDRRELMEAAIQGVLGKLDPYSTYINPEKLGQFRSTVESEFGGIGIQITVQGPQLKIISPLVGTPAYRAGLMAGDNIVEIDGESTDGLSLDEAVRRLKGKEGTEVTIGVIHVGSSKKEKVTVRREIIHVETVLGDRRKEDDSWDFILKGEEQVGYLRVSAFSRDTADEIRKTLEGLRDGGLRGLILDLRFNPGGLLTSAIEVSDLFVAQGRIVSTKGRNSPERKWDAHESGTFEDFPMVVLVNRYSASASEIVSACLQDHKRAVVMGERTYGKGSVQNVIELEGGRSALKLTTAGYRRPSGKNIDRHGGDEKEEWGVTPDDGFELKLDDDEMLGLIEYRRKRDALQPKNGQPKEPDESDGQTEEPPPPQDDPKPNGDGPAEDNGNIASPEDQPEDEPEDQPADEPADEPEKAEFVDRQLQTAVEYLVEQLAEAKQG